MAYTQLDDRPQKISYIFVARFTAEFSVEIRNHISMSSLFFVMALICFLDVPISLRLAVLIAGFAATHREYFPGNEFVKSRTVVQPNTYVLC